MFISKRKLHEHDMEVRKDFIEFLTTSFAGTDHEIIGALQKRHSFQLKKHDSSVVQDFLAFVRLNADDKTESWSTYDLINLAVEWEAKGGYEPKEDLDCQKKI